MDANNIPAFPLSAGTGSPHDCNQGMTLRDYFAAKGATGYIASYGPDQRVDPAHTAKFAYEFADAMLSERSKEQP